MASNVGRNFQNRQIAKSSGGGSGGNEYTSSVKRLSTSDVIERGKAEQQKAYEAQQSRIYRYQSGQIDRRQYVEEQRDATYLATTGEYSPQTQSRIKRESEQRRSEALSNLQSKTTPKQETRIITQQASVQAGTGEGLQEAVAKPIIRQAGQSDDSVLNKLTESLPSRVATQSYEDEARARNFALDVATFNAKVRDAKKGQITGDTPMNKRSELEAKRTALINRAEELGSTTERGVVLPAKTIPKMEILPLYSDGSAFLIEGEGKNDSLPNRVSDRSNIRSNIVDGVELDSDSEVKESKLTTFLKKSPADVISGELIKSDSQVVKGIGGGVLGVQNMVQSPVRGAYKLGKEAVSQIKTTGTFGETPLPSRGYMTKSDGRGGRMPLSEIEYVRTLTPEQRFAYEERLRTDTATVKDPDVISFAALTAGAALGGVGGIVAGEAAGATSVVAQAAPKAMTASTAIFRSAAAVNVGYNVPKGVKEVIEGKPVEAGGTFAEAAVMAALAGIPEGDVKPSKGKTSGFGKIRINVEKSPEPATFKFSIREKPTTPTSKIKFGKVNQDLVYRKQGIFIENKADEAFAALFGRLEKPPQSIFESGGGVQVAGDVVVKKINPMRTAFEKGEVVKVGEFEIQNTNIGKPTEVQTSLKKFGSLTEPQPTRVYGDAAFQKRVGDIIKKADENLKKQNKGETSSQATILEETPKKTSSGGARRSETGATKQITEKPPKTTAKKGFAAKLAEETNIKSRVEPTSIRSSVLRVNIKPIIGATQFTGLSNIYKDKSKYKFDIGEKQNNIQGQDASTKIIQEESQDFTPIQDQTRNPDITPILLTGLTTVPILTKTPPSKIIKDPLGKFNLDFNPYGSSRYKPSAYLFKTGKINRVLNLTGQESIGKNIVGSKIRGTQWLGTKFGSPKIIRGKNELPLVTNKGRGVLYPAMPKLPNLSGYKLRG